MVEKNNLVLYGVSIKKLWPQIIHLTLQQTILDAICITVQYAFRMRIRMRIRIL